MRRQWESMKLRVWSWSKFPQIQLKKSIVCEDSNSSHEIHVCLNISQTILQTATYRDFFGLRWCSRLSSSRDRFLSLLLLLLLLLCRCDDDDDFECLSRLPSLCEEEWFLSRWLLDGLLRTNVQSGHSMCLIFETILSSNAHNAITSCAMISCATVVGCCAFACHDCQPSSKSKPFC